jgi:hypothetical protein
MTSAQQRATKRYRDRRRKSGLQRLEVQVPAAEADVIRKAAEILRAQAEEAKQLRAHLGLGAEPGGPKNALDIFAMVEPLPPAAERLWEQAMRQVERERKDASLHRPRDVNL